MIDVNDCKLLVSLSDGELPAVSGTVVLGHLVVSRLAGFGESPPHFACHGVDSPDALFGMLVLQSFKLRLSEEIECIPVQAKITQALLK